VDSTSESLLWIADIVGWCFGAGREWRKTNRPDRDLAMSQLTGNLTTLSSGL
jgi:hypothetical protein